jgi:hypothetical protein
MNKKTKTKNPKTIPKKKKNHLPNNVSEKEFLEVWEKISKKLCY